MAACSSRRYLREADRRWYPRRRNSSRVRMMSAPRRTRPAGMREGTAGWRRRGRRGTRWVRRKGRRGRFQQRPQSAKHSRSPCTFVHRDSFRRPGCMGPRSEVARTLLRSHTSARRRTRRIHRRAARSDCRCSRDQRRTPRRPASTRRLRVRGTHRRCRPTCTRAGTRSRAPRCIDRTRTRRGRGSLMRHCRARRARRVARIRSRRRERTSRSR